jgi:hypothetical protein
MWWDPFALVSLIDRSGRCFTYLASFHCDHDCIDLCVHIRARFSSDKIRRWCERISAITV